MKGDTRAVEYLNRGLRNELTAVRQFWLHYRRMENWGYNGLAKKWREESIEEMEHADRFRGSSSRWRRRTGGRCGRDLRGNPAAT